MNKKKVYQMSEHISTSLSERLAEQISNTLVEALYPAIRQMGDGVEQIAQDIKYQDETGIHDIADSFLNRLLQQSNDYSTQLVTNFQKAHEIQSIYTVQSEVLLNKLIEQNMKLTEQRELEQEEHRNIMKQSFELISLQQGAISKLSENQEILSIRLDQMQEQYNMVNEQQKQSMLQIEKFSKGQEQLHKHSEVILEVFANCQRQWIDDLKCCSDNLDQQSRLIENNLTAISGDIKSNLESASMTLLEASTKAKSCIDILDGSFVTYQQKLERNIHDIFDEIDQHLAGITRSLGQSAAEIADASKAVPRAMRTVIEEMKQEAER